MSNFMIACVLLNISKNNSGLKGLLIKIKPTMNLANYTNKNNYMDVLCKISCNANCL